MRAEGHLKSDFTFIPAADWARAPLVTSAVSTLRRPLDNPVGAFVGKAKVAGGAVRPRRWPKAGESTAASGLSKGKGETKLRRANDLAAERTVPTARSCPFKKKKRKINK